MIQSRFQQQHSSKHPQRPLNGGSGPAIPPVSRDATSNMRKHAAAPDATATTRRPHDNVLKTMDSHGVEDVVRNLRRPLAPFPDSHRSPLPEPKEMYKDKLYRGRTRGQK